MPWAAPASSSSSLVCFLFTCVKASIHDVFWFGVSGDITGGDPWAVASAAASSADIPVLLLLRPVYMVPARAYLPTDAFKLLLHGYYWDLLWSTTSWFTCYCPRTYYSWSLDVLTVSIWNFGSSQFLLGAFPEACNVLAPMLNVY